MFVSRKRKYQARGGRFRKRVKTGRKSFSRQAFGGGTWGGNVTGYGGRPTQAVIRAPRILPDRIQVVLTKSIVGTLSTGAAGAFQSSPLQVNDLKDPSGAFGTGGPTGSTPWSNFYQQYCVHAFRVRLRACTQGSSSASSSVLALFPRPASGAQCTSMAQVVANPRSKSAIMQFGAPPVDLSIYMKTAQLYGQSEQTVASADSFSATMGATPASAVWVDVCIVDPALSTQNGVDFIMEVTQYCEFFGRITQAA